MSVPLSAFSIKLQSMSQYGGDIRRVFMLGQKLKQENPNLNLIDLSLGNPDIEPPPEVDQVLQEILSRQEKSSHRYMDAAGLPEVRQFLANELTLSEKVSVVADSVYLTVGAAGGIQILLRTFVDVGDEVIIFAPYFPEYYTYILNFGAVPVVCPCDEFHKPDLEQLEKLLSDKTKLVLINSPNNPTGVIYDELFFQKFFSTLKNHAQKTGRALPVISDEPYARVAFEKESCPSLMPLYDHLFVVRSFSKDLGLAGERIGYIVFSKELLQIWDQLPYLLRNASRILGFVSAPRLMQRMIPQLFHLKVDVSIYEKRIKAFENILKHNGISVVSPQAGFFIFPQSPISDDRQFCQELIGSGVLCVPGSAFGAPGYFRASLTQPLEIVEEAAKQIVQCANLFK